MSPDPGGLGLPQTTGKVPLADGPMTHLAGRYPLFDVPRNLLKDRQTNALEVIPALVIAQNCEEKRIERKSNRACGFPSSCQNEPLDLRLWEKIKLHVSQGSLEEVPIQLENCISTPGANYQCVRIEDCNDKRQRGSQQFCKWESKPTHVCCLEKRSDHPMGKFARRDKREYQSYYDDDDYESSMEYFNRDNRGWRHEYDDWEMPWTKHRRQSDDRMDYGFDHEYDDDSKIIPSMGSRGAFDSDDTECGVLADEINDGVLGRIFGGSPVQTAASSPWMVAIGKTDLTGKPEFFCGGALLSQTIILTAAHCVTQRSPNMVRVGELDMNSNTEPAEPQDSLIEASTIHPDYSKPRHYNDIAIVRLKTPVRYSKYVRPICLPPDDGNLYENAPVTLTGWGDIKSNGKASPLLHKVEINVISNSQCNDRYRDALKSSRNIRALPRGIIDSQMCARDELGGRDACKGDSGGPIVRKNGRRRIVVGIVSSGLGCGERDHPGIYTRVSRYTDWIRSFL
ncbi:phenoloxidase-activating enzyme 1-like [Diprion similis]|uniref:phenoloxidase-activating enzyme 1-like n=1 Tax=Diprion similis TaxID=362088 RepID=UPI001EF7A97B|nr:phenoloxidase-activating enzyme 1-like [Diprion similis]